MTKMNWEKNNKEKKIRDKGSEPATISESPVGRRQASAAAGHRAELAPRKRQQSQSPPPKKMKSPAAIEASLNGYIHELIRCKLLGQSLPRVPASLRKIYDTPSDAMEQLQVEPRYKTIWKKLERHHIRLKKRKRFLDPREERAAKLAEQRSGGKIDAQPGKRDYQVTRVGKIRVARQVS